MRAYRVLEDGTRVYSNGVRYKPKSPAERKYKVRKPDNPDAVRWRGEWIEFVPLLQSEARVMPQTRPDEQAFDHYVLKERCQCEVCRRPESKRWRRLGRRERRRLTQSGIGGSSSLSSSSN
jgi:hypothetical protein